MRVIATSDYAGSMINKNFRFQISYSTENNFGYLRSNIGYKYKTKSLHSEQLRHYITRSVDKDIRVSLTSFSGNP